MTSATKQRLSGAVCVICAGAMVFFISRMIPYGLAGNTGKVKLYFAGVMVALVISLPSGVAYYYYRGNSKKDEDLERMRTEVAVLGRVGQNAAEAKPPVPRADDQSKRGRS